ncbi:hypothetical protein Slit_1703 [Sideroxydans lithotrophicus ES-1]|uniref:Uncharacterized protein n=2 Tax=Sideroxydans TaxID=314343 RepID=D5CSK0_SIDLE|nr:hypothetical protein Slit_1703 [Sideroxydans lithotrophicus ES-1]
MNKGGDVHLQPIQPLSKSDQPSFPASGSTADGHMAVFTKTGKFEDVRDDVEMAITGRGLVVNNVSHVGEMLERTGKDLGDDRQIYLKAEALEFCSAVVSRKMMETDPDNIVFCPYIISVYVLPGKPNEVRIAYRKPQIVGSQASQAALKAVDELLSGIVKDALQ